MTRFSRRPIRLVKAGVVTLSLALAGCGGSGRSASSNTKSTSTTPAPATTSTTSPPADASRLHAIVVQSSDLPAGWTSADPSPNPNKDTNQAAFTQCVGIRDTDPDRVADADSQDFSLKDASISASATSYPTQADVDVDVSAFSNPKINTCFEQGLRRGLATSLPAGTTVRSVTAKAVPGSAGGPANVVATLTATVTVTNPPATFYENIAFITGPRIESSVEFFNVGAPVPASLRSAVIDKVAARTAQG